MTVDTVDLTDLNTFPFAKGKHVFGWDFASNYFSNNHS